MMMVMMMKETRVVGFGISVTQKRLENCLKMSHTIEYSGTKK